MELETTLSQTIRTAGSNSDYDSACKRLLSEKIILAWIMKNCLEEYRECSISEIIEKYIEGEPQVAEVPVLPDQTNPSLINGERTEDKTITEGTITYDIRFTATAPKSGELIRLIINVEAQNNFYPGYPLLKRSIYYCSRMISAQYGTVFSSAQYDKIRKVYSIWICMNPPKSRENTITQYYIAEKSLVGHVTEKVENYDLMSAVMICLGKPDSENYHGVLKLLNVLLSSETTPKEKERILHDDFDIEMSQNLEREVSLMCNLSQDVVDRTLLSAIQHLMETLNLTAEQAMAALKIPETERPKYISWLEEQ